MVHAWVSSPDGQGFDAGGFFDKETLSADYLGESPIQWTNQKMHAFDSEQNFALFLGTTIKGDKKLREWFIGKRLEDEAQAALTAVECYVIPVHLPDRDISPSPR